jgi:hypothetical protein
MAITTVSIFCRQQPPSYCIHITVLLRSYVPTLFALKLPEIFLALGLAGTVGALVDHVAARASDKSPSRFSSGDILAAGLPPAVAVAPRPAMYNCIRHFIFVLPPIAVLGGRAVTWFAAFLQRLPPATRFFRPFQHARRERVH